MRLLIPAPSRPLEKAFFLEALMELSKIGYSCLVFGVLIGVIIGHSLNYKECRRAGFLLFYCVTK